MAVNVVHSLEAVEVDAQDRHVVGALVRFGDRSGEMIGEDGPVGEAGQGVVKGEMRDPLRRFLALRNVAHREDPKVGAAPGERAEEQFDLAALAVGPEQPAFRRRRVRSHGEGAEIDLDE